MKRYTKTLVFLITLSIFCLSMLTYSCSKASENDAENNGFSISGTIVDDNNLPIPDRVEVQMDFQKK